jgi:hypothetical protein
MCERDTYSQDRLVTDTWTESGGRNLMGQQVERIFYRDRTVTDYYCVNCNQYIEFPGVSSRKEYIDRWSADRSAALWFIIVIGLAYISWKESNWLYMAWLVPLFVAYKLFPIVFGLGGGVAFHLFRLIFSNVILALAFAIFGYFGVAFLQGLLQLDADGERNLQIAGLALAAILLLGVSIELLGNLIRDIGLAFRVYFGARRRSSPGPLIPPHQSPIKGYFAGFALPNTGQPFIWKQLTSKQRFTAIMLNIFIAFSMFVAPPMVVWSFEGPNWLIVIAALFSAAFVSFVGWAMISQWRRTKD